MLLAYAIIVVFALYFYVQFYAPQKSGFTDATVQQQVNTAQNATIKQTVVADQAVTDAIAASTAASQTAAEVAAHVNDIKTLVATSQDAMGGAETAASQSGAKEIERALRAADLEKQKARLAEKHAEIQQQRLDQKKLIEQAKVARAQAREIPREEKQRLATLDPAQKKMELQVAASQKALIADQIEAKKAEIEILKSELKKTNEVEDAIAPPGLGKRMGRLFS